VSGGAKTPGLAVVGAILDAPSDPSRLFFSNIQRRLRTALDNGGAPASVIDRCIAKLAAGEDLSDDEARGGFHAILEGGLEEDQVGAFLVLLAPERLPATTIASFANVVFERAKRVPFYEPGPLGDTCGTGGDARGTFNVSTTIMFILAAGGFRIAKHGNRAFTSKCGSADVLEALGVRIDLGPDGVATCLRECNLGFMFAPKFHESFRNVSPIRKKLAEEMPPFVPKKTIFNALGPLANPAGATTQIIGVFDRGLTGKFADVLRRRGIVRALVPYGLPASDGEKGFDEFSTAGPTVYAELANGEVTSKTIEPQEAGLRPLKDPDVLVGGDKEENARILRGILSLEERPERIDFALLNAGAGFYVAGKATSIREGVSLARSVLQSGAALRSLEALCRVSQRLAESRDL